MATSTNVNQQRNGHQNSCCKGYHTKNDDDRAKDASWGQPKHSEPEPEPKCDRNGLGARHADFCDPARKRGKLPEEVQAPKYHKDC